MAVVMAPFFFKIGQEELVEYLLRIADASPIPVAIYHHYRMTTPIEVETVARVAKHENIVAVKDTNAEIDRTQSLIEATAGLQFSVLQGSERLLLQSLPRGANGMVAALAGFAPEAFAALYQAVRSHDDATAKQQHAYIMRLLEILLTPAARESISAFAHSIKLAIKSRGWLDCADVMMPGFKTDEAFERSIQNDLLSLTMPTPVPRGELVFPPHAATV